MKCPKELKSKDMVCPECEMVEECNWKVKKQPMATCGCGGSYVCKCGYREEFCLPHFEKDSSPLKYCATIDCPFCGREAKWESSRLTIAIESGKLTDSWDELSPKLFSNV
jgi:hypothetical protein